MICRAPVKNHSVKVELSVGLWKQWLKVAVGREITHMAAKQLPRVQQSGTNRAQGAVHQ